LKCFLHFTHRGGWLAFRVDGRIGHALAENLSVLLQRQFHPHVSVFAIGRERARHRYRAGELNDIGLGERFTKMKHARCSERRNLQEVTAFHHNHVSKG
jgi:hypothetical protein